MKTASTCQTIRTLGQLKTAIASMPDSTLVWVDGDEASHLIAADLAYYPTVPGSPGFVIFEPACTLDDEPVEHPDDTPSLDDSLHQHEMDVD